MRVSIANCSKSSSALTHTIKTILQTACTMLIDRNEISEDSAATLVASYAKGGLLVSGVHDFYLESGNADGENSLLQMYTNSHLLTLLCDLFILSRVPQHAVRLGQTPGGH